MHDINVSFCGSYKLLIERFPAFMVDVFKKSKLSTMLMIHKITWVLFSSMSWILKYRNYRILLHTIVMLDICKSI